jgi:hypothetical protein
MEYEFLLPCSKEPDAGFRPEPVNTVHIFTLILCGGTLGTVVTTGLLYQYLHTIFQIYFNVMLPPVSWISHMVFSV